MSRADLYGRPADVNHWVRRKVRAVRQSVRPMNSSSAADAIAHASIIVVACSGGSDSAAALLETRRLAPTAAVIACYVDHGVRPRASIDRDIAAVQAQAAAANARVVVAHLVWHARRAGRSESALRRARYRALREAAMRAGASVIVTGHHAGDVAEWVLIAMLRGSGIDGLASMPELRPVAKGIALARPLLRRSKDVLAKNVRRARLPVSIDETNAQPRYARNLVRSFLAAMSARGASPEKTLARSAALVAEDRMLLDTLVRAELDLARSSGAHDALDVSMLRSLPPAVLRRVVRMIVRDVAGTTADFSLIHCEAIAVAIRERRGGEFHAGKTKVLLSAGLLRVVRGQASHPRRVWGRPLRSAKRMSEAHPTADDDDTNTVRLRAASLPREPKFTIRRSAPGDTCIPSGRRHPVSLARFLAKEGVPREQRATVPLLCVDGRIAAAVGVRVMEPFAPHPGDPAVDVTWHPTALSGHIDSTDIFKMKHSSP
jgi:tRNA(Ile)-lysidine synthase